MIFFYSHVGKPVPVIDPDHLTYFMKYKRMEKDKPIPLRGGQGILTFKDGSRVFAQGCWAHGMSSEKRLISVVGNICKRIKTDEKQ